MEAGHERSRAHAPPCATPALRRCVLALAVLHDVDLVPSDTGVVLEVGGPARASVVLPWPEIADAVGGAAADSSLAVDRLLTHVRVRRLLARRPEEVERRVRPVGLPAGHVLHPGPAWVAARVPGGVLQLGLGIVADEPDAGAVVLCPPAALRAAGYDAGTLWPPALDYLERTGTVAGSLLRDRGDGVLRPVGDCDVLTLLGAASFRRVLCEGLDGPMRAVAAPVRTRGWLDLRRIDPAFALAAAAAVDPADRGFTRLLLVTPDEVALARSGGSAQSALADPAPPSAPWTRPVRYR